MQADGWTAKIYDKTEKQLTVRKCCVMFLLHRDRDINISALLELDMDWIKMHGMEIVEYNMDGKKYTVVPTI